MRVITDFLSSSGFEVLTPGEQTRPFVFGSPHSGSDYPSGFLEQSRLDQRRVRLSEDAYVDRLFAHVPAAGAPLVRAHFPRAYLDVNREPYELDPRMFSEKLPAFVNSRSPRVAAGLGTVPRVVSDGEEIYSGPITVAEALWRIEKLYKPYHAALRRLLAATHVRFGCAVLVDCHSMPSNYRGQDPRHRADFVLGDRHGTSATRALTDVAANTLGDQGYRVGVNKPYAGGFITEHYGRPARGLHALQIEINRALYMDEKTLEPHAGMERLAADIQVLTERLMALPCELLSPLPGRFASE
jgi:N-formylglutamate amidohydrolase